MGDTTVSFEQAMSKVIKRRGSVRGSVKQTQQKKSIEDHGPANKPHQFVKIPSTVVEESSREQSIRSDSDEEKSEMTFIEHLTEVGDEDGFEEDDEGVVHKSGSMII